MKRLTSTRQLFERLRPKTGLDTTTARWRRLSRGLGIIIALTVVGPSTIHAQRYVEWDAKSADARSISGYKASKHDSRQPGNNAVLYGLVFDEKGDQPCFLKLKWWRYTSSSDRQDFTTQFNICNGKTKDNKEIVLERAVEQQMAVHSLKVCTNNKSNHRLKGAEIAGSFIDQGNSGAVRPAGSGSNEKFSRTNCADWHTASVCASGEVAVGVQIEHSGEEITGLGLVCAKPVVQVIASPAAGKFAAMERGIVVKTDSGNTTMTIAQAIDTHRVAGATVVTIDKGAIDGVGHYGLRDFNDNRPTNKNTIYQAASMSKFVAALGIVKASRQGLGPRLDDDVESLANQHPKDLLDDWVRRKFDKKEEDYPRDITLRRLLSHTAGLSVHTIGTSSLSGFTDMRNILIGDITVGRPGVKPLFAPGIRYEYSGGGFTVAEAMFETRSERMAREYLNNDVLIPYGMSRSTFNKATSDMEHLARGCSKSPCLYDVWFTNVKFAGGLLAHPEDYAHLLTLVLNNGKDQSGQQIIPWSDLVEVMTPAYHKSNTLESCHVSISCAQGEICFSGRCIKPIQAGGGWYGLGVELSDSDMFQDFPNTLWHGGAHMGFRSHFEINRRNKTGIVIMVNGDGEWKKGDVQYGGQALVNDILKAFRDAY